MSTAPEKLAGAVSLLRFLRLHNTTTTRATHYLQRSRHNGFFRRGRWQPIFSHPLTNHSAIDQPDIPATGECLRILRELTGSNHKTPASTFGSHDPEKLADNIDTHFYGFPLLALHESLFTITEEHQVNTTISAIRSFVDSIALSAKGLADHLFKLLPSDAFQSLRGYGRASNRSKEPRAASALQQRNYRAEDEDSWKDILSEHSEDYDNLLAGVPTVAEMRKSPYLAPSQMSADKVGRERENEAQPPGHLH
nr:MULTISPECIES: hypothetical protein [Pseudomonas]